MKTRSGTVYTLANGGGCIRRKQIKNKLKRIVDAIKKECAKDPSLFKYVSSKGRECTHMATKYNLIVMRFNTST